MGFCLAGECTFTNKWGNISNAKCSRCGRLDGSKASVKKELAARRAAKKELGTNKSTKRTKQTATSSRAKSKPTGTRSTRGGTTKIIRETIREKEPEGSLPSRVGATIPRGTHQKAITGQAIDRLGNQVFAGRMIKSMPKSERNNLELNFRKNINKKQVNMDYYKSSKRVS